MADVCIGRPVPKKTVFQVILRFLGQIEASNSSGDTELGRLERDKSTVQALSRLSDEQLSDIGVYRKPRRVRSDYLSRDFHPRCQVDFDYYHVDD